MKEKIKSDLILLQASIYSPNYKYFYNKNRMLIYQNISLKKYNTFGLDYQADFIANIENEKDAAALFRQKRFSDKPFLVLGSGSNILFINDFKGTIIHPLIGGIRIEEEDDQNVIISAGAGVNWDYLVEWTVNNGYGGLENLSKIPGLTGATPVQNIGAYGVEVKDKIVKVRTICINDSTIYEFSNKECRFDYRTSIFKSSEKGRHLITKVFYKLSARHTPDLSYGSLKDEVLKSGSITLKNIRQAVISIRSAKLPDPSITGNAGSFFKNPAVSDSSAEKMKMIYPGLPLYPDKSGAKKLSAGWLIEQCGWKGRRIGDAGTHDIQALVLVNYGNASGRDIFNLSEKIRKSVFDKFGIELEREVEVV